ncbi:MAG: hypothetical protein EBR88_02590, partial [Betaproteobacteria bacterium]|nr:hypothetical protein [Betaproteobacteria bacterium]
INNQAAQNRALEFGAGAANTAGLQNASLGTQAARDNATAQNQFALSNQAATNRASEFGAAATNAASSQNAQLGTQVSLENAQRQTQTALANAQNTAAVQQFNAGQLNQVNEANAQRGQQASLANAEATNKLIMQQYDNAFRAAVATADNATKIELQNIDANARRELANIEATYKQTMQTTASASEAYQQAMKNISDLYANPDLDATAVSAAVEKQLEILRNGMTLLDTLNNSVSGLGALVSFKSGTTNTGTTNTGTTNTGTTNTGTTNTGTTNTGTTNTGTTNTGTTNTSTQTVGGRALPAGWSGYTAAQKISWYNSRGVTPNDLTNAGVDQGTINWMRQNGYTVGLSRDLDQQDAIDANTVQPVSQVPVSSDTQTAQVTPTPEQQEQATQAGITLPGDWGARDANAKIAWFNANGVTEGQLQAGGVDQGTIDWMRQNGYTVGQSSGLISGARTATQ